MKKYFLLTGIAVLALACFLTYQYIIFNDGKLHIVFCDVGQGDGILVRTPGGKYLLFDAGPDKKILECLGRHMPLWQRTVDAAFLSHPHSDHFMGYFYVKDRYTIKSFVTEKLDNKTPAFQLLMKDLKEKKIPITYVLLGDRFHIGDGVELVMEGPSHEFLAQTSPGGKIGESKEFASLITRITYGSFNALITGDTQAGELADAAEDMGKSVTVMQVPHHGSASGMNVNVLEKLAPKLAVISVGKNNYGHPTLATLQLLTVPGVTVKRTDKDGDVEIVSDGSKW